MDYQVRGLAARQADVVARWQLLEAGWSRGKVAHHVQARGWRSIHPGVYALNHSALTQRQLWFAAVLTKRGSVLSHGSAGACWGFYRFDRGFEVITRPGTGGRRRHGRLLVFRSTDLDRDVTHYAGLPITTAARVLIDLAPRMNDKRIRRAFRESIRLRCTTTRRVRETAERHRGWPGTPVLAALASRYAAIPYGRTRSDAEGLALELLGDAGRPAPLVNVNVGGEEADLVWPRYHLIVELDGPQFHRFRDEDARKAAVWRKAGFVVRRISTDAVYDAPSEFLDLCPPPER